MDAIVKFAKTYWPVIGLGIVIVFIFVLINNQSNTIDGLEADIEEMESQAENQAEIAENLPDDFDSDAHTEKIETSTVSAKEIGKSIVKLDDALTAFYKTAEPLPEDEAEREEMFDALEANQALNEDMRGITNHGDTWQLNPDWTLTLDSVVAYQATDQLPVIFSMKTESGENAGVVHATYNVADNTLTNITRQYTAAGLEDAASIGGR